MLFFFYTDLTSSATYTLSLHDALPICLVGRWRSTPPNVLPQPAIAPRSSLRCGGPMRLGVAARLGQELRSEDRSEEHTSELQSRGHLVCRLLLEKKNKFKYIADFLVQE